MPHGPPVKNPLSNAGFDPCSGSWDSACHGAAKHMCPNYKTCTLQLGSPLATMKTQHSLKEGKRKALAWSPLSWSSPPAPHQSWPLLPHVLPPPVSVCSCNTSLWTLPCLSSSSSLYLELYFQRNLWWITSPSTSLS